LIPEAGVFAAAVDDPANHECCVTPPTENAKISFTQDEITVSADVSGHWLNFTAPFDADDPTLF